MSKIEKSAKPVIEFDERDREEIAYALMARGLHMENWVGARRGSSLMEKAQQRKDHAQARRLQGLAKTLRKGVPGTKKSGNKTVHGDGTSPARVAQSLIRML